VKRPFLRRPSPAMVVALLALFVAMGGTGYAALKLPKNSVKATQIAKTAVGASEIKTGGVGTSEVKNRSLLAKDFKAGQLPAGPQGLKGDTGAPGAPGTARAYGEVDKDGLQVGDAHRNATVRRKTTGTYCIKPAAGIDPTTTVPVVTGNFSTIDRQTLANIREGHFDCDDGEFEVITFDPSVAQTAPGAVKDSGFSFVIP
jgi:hypothetical protein